MQTGWHPSELPAPSRLRHKLGPVYGHCLVTEYRAGYQFRPLNP